MLRVKLKLCATAGKLFKSIIFEKFHSKHLSLFDKYCDTNSVQTNSFSTHHLSNLAQAGPKNSKSRLTKSSSRKCFCKSNLACFYLPESYVRGPAPTVIETTFRENLYELMRGSNKFVHSAPQAQPIFWAGQ